MIHTVTGKFITCSFINPGSPAAMCLIAFALGQNSHFPLVLAANRDEFYQRPTAPMAWWTTEANTEVLSGRDQRSGGTWLAVTRDGRISAVTNVREGSPEAGRVSRGELPLRALQEPEARLQQSLVDNPDRYAGFNLVSLSGPGGWYFSNRDAHPGRQVHKGTYGLSNHLLQTPWPKLVRLRDALGQAVATTSGSQDELHRTLTTLLQDPTPAPDHLLPDTGVPRETERFLSSVFIAGDQYGTRATTVVSITHDHRIQVTEQAWEPGGVKGEFRRFHWQR